MCEHLSWSIEWWCILLYARARCSHASRPGRFSPVPAIIPLGWFSPPPSLEFSLIVNYFSWFVKPHFRFSLSPYLKGRALHLRPRGWSRLSVREDHPTGSSQFPDRVVLYCHTLKIARFRRCSHGQNRTRR